MRPLLYLSAMCLGTIVGIIVHALCVCGHYADMADLRRYIRAVGKEGKRAWIDNDRKVMLRIFDQLANLPLE